MAPVEDVAQQVLMSGVDVGKRDLDLADDPHRSVGSVGHAGEGVDGRHLQRELESADTGQVGGQDQQVGAEGQRWQGPGEVEREPVQVGGIVVLVFEVEHEVFERQQDPGVDLEGQVQVERTAAGIFGVQVDLPRLAQGVGLHEVAFVVDVEPVVHGMVFQIGDEAGDVDDRHEHSCTRKGTRPACHAGRRSPTVTEVTAPLDDPSRIAGVLDDVAGAVADALAATVDWGESGLRDGQYLSDLSADAAATSVLTEAGYGVLSEESGRHHHDREITVVVDPLDGSTNASRRLAWWATSLCAVDRHGPLVSLVVDLRHGDRWTATRGGGAFRNDEAIRTSGCRDLSQAIVGLNGVPQGHGGWAQYRALGAAALDLCAVADGTLDGYLDCTTDELGVWDYLGAALVCIEAGGVIVDAAGRELAVLDHGARRIPVAAASGELGDVLGRLHPTAGRIPTDDQ